jgi:hypothetical protein
MSANMSHAVDDAIFIAHKSHVKFLDVAKHLDSDLYCAENQDMDEYLKMAEEAVRRRRELNADEGYGAPSGNATSSSSASAAPRAAYDFTSVTSEVLQAAPQSPVGYMKPTAKRLSLAPRRRVDSDELFELREEESEARMRSIPWQERGPPPGVLPKGATWRGQRFRPISGKWANRGGRNASWYRGYYEAKGKGADAAHAYRVEHPFPKKA